MAKKVAKTAAELEAMIIERLKAEPICPDGFLVQVEGAGDRWAIVCDPPPQRTAGGVVWADCCNRANQIASEMRRSYSLAPISN